MRLKRPTPRDRYLLFLYGITEYEYDRILDTQGGGCGICGRAPGTIRLSVDHNHKTGEVRGILCMTCNKAVAYLRDDAITAHRAYRYIDVPPAPSALGYGVMGRVGRSTRKWRTKKERRERMTWVTNRLAELGYGK